MNNSKATKLLKQMYKMHPKMHWNQANIIRNGVKVYQENREKKNHFVINTFLKFLIHFESKGSEWNIVWSDIEEFIASHNHHKHALISYPSLLKIIVSSPSLNRTQIICNSIQILDWIQSANYRLKPFETINFSRSISCVIGKCDHFDQLEQIEAIIA